MENLSRRRCHHHALREAAARCPECAEYFCRECVTEHEDRVICATCLRKLSATSKKKRKSFRALLQLAQCLFSILLLWLFFLLCGRALQTAPASFHDTTFWKAPMSEESK